MLFRLSFVVEKRGSFGWEWRQFQVIADSLSQAIHLVRAVAHTQGLTIAEDRYMDFIAKAAA